MFGKMISYLLPYLVVPLISARVPLISTRVSVHLSGHPIVESDHLPDDCVLVSASLTLQFSKGWPLLLLVHSVRNTKNMAFIKSQIKFSTTVIMKTGGFCQIKGGCKSNFGDINTLAPGRPGCHFKTEIFNLVLLIAFFRSFNDNAPRWMPQDLTDDKSTLVQLWCNKPIPEPMLT